MKWFALLGLLLFLGVAVAPSINANMKESEIIEPEAVEKKFEKLVGLVEGIISYYERTYETSDCGCEEQEPTPWSFPVICLILYPLFALTHMLNAFQLILFREIVVDFTVGRLNDILESLNCSYVE